MYVYIYIDIDIYIYIYIDIYIYIYIYIYFSDGVTPKTTHVIIGIQLKLSSSVLNVLGNCNSSLT